MFNLSLINQRFYAPLIPDIVVSLFVLYLLTIYESFCCGLYEKQYNSL